MTLITQTTISKINLLLLLGLCLGGSNMLHAAQNDEVDDEKNHGPYGEQNEKKQIVTGWQCSKCTLINKSNSKSCRACGGHYKEDHENKKDIQYKKEKVIINVRRRYGSYFDPFYDYFYAFSVSIPYQNDIVLNDVLDKIIKSINNKVDKQEYMHCIAAIGLNSFIGKSVENNTQSAANHEWETLVNQKITSWDKSEIIKKGLEISIEDRYHHSPKGAKISCPYIKNKNTLQYSGLDLALQCPIYHAAKADYKFSEDVKNHLHFFSHFLDAYTEKPVCRHGAGCKSFIRLEHNGNLVNDLCHIKIYRHPPRSNRQIQLGKNIHRFVCNQKEKENKPLYEPNDKEAKNLLQLLLDEVIKNEYQYDLCLICSKDDKCNHNVYQKNNKHNLVSCIQEKFNHPRYTKMKKPFHGGVYNPDALMLSLILYTGCDCNYDLCKSQRNGHYDKWKMFDLCLWNAICKLSAKEYGAYKLYSGLKNTKLATMNISTGYFPTYTSTTVHRDIAEKFAGQKGMVIEIDQTVRNAFICCDLSWISKFGDNEYEVLIARTPCRKNVFAKNPANYFSVKILDDKHGLQTVLLKKRSSYDLACQDIISIISAMIKGDEPIYEATSLDVSMFNKLTLGAKDVPADVQQRWNEFRHQQQRITINIGDMYKHYKTFTTLLCDPKCKNLLLLDTIVQLFPNATEISCMVTDYNGRKKDEFGDWETDCSSSIVSSNFIFGLKERLSKINKRKNLKNISITTWKTNIGDDCKLYTKQFAALGWKIGKGSRQIMLTKDAYDVMCKDAIAKISSTIRAAECAPSATTLDVQILNKLIFGSNDLPSDIQKKWDEFRHQQQIITVNMLFMYRMHAVFIPLLCSSDPKCKNLLLLDKLVILFPNVTGISCVNTNNITGGFNREDYSPSIVGSDFILKIKDMLNKMHKNAKLKEIMISIFNSKLKDDCDLYVEEFSALGWKIQVYNQKRIELTKEPYDVMRSIICEGIIPKISCIIKAADRDTSKLTSASVSAVFNKLITGAKDVPLHLKQIWDELRNKQQSIKINMHSMYRYHDGFIPLLFSSDPKCKNLLLLDKIAKLFPNVTEIICLVTDCIKGGKYSFQTEYSADIVCSNFMLGLKERLSKIDKKAKLKKVIIQTEKYKIKDSCSLYATQFGALGWQIKRETYKGSWIKNNQITLTKISGGLK